MKIKQITLHAVVVAAFVFASGSAASAAVLFTFDIGQPATNYTPEALTIGSEFTVGAVPLTVTHLGAYIIPTERSAGLTMEPYVSQLYGKTGVNTGTLLGEVTIPVGTPIDADGFAYAAFSYALAANTNYVVADYGSQYGVGNGANTGYSFGPIGVDAGTFDPAVTFVSHRYLYGYIVGSTVFPSSTNNVYVHFLGGNLQFVVPEPASLGLLAAGGAVLLRRRRA